MNSRYNEFRRMDGPSGRRPIFCWDVAKLVKARGFDPRIRRFESCRPSHFHRD